MKIDRDEAATGAADGLDKESQAQDPDNHKKDDRRSFAGSLPLDQFFDDRREKTFASLGRVSNVPADDFPWKLQPEKRELIQAVAKASDDEATTPSGDPILPADILALAAEGARPNSVDLAESNRVWWKSRAASPIWQKSENPPEKLSLLARILESRSLKDADRIINDVGFSEDERHALFKTESFARRTVYTRDYAVIPRVLRLLFSMVPKLIFSPRTVPQLCRFLSYANVNRIKLTPRGRGTWALGGALLTKGGVVLEMASLEKKIEVDAARHLVTVSASVDFQEAEEALNQHGLTLVSRPSNKYGVIAGFLSVGEPLKGGLGLNAIDAGHVINSVDTITVATADGQTQRLDRASQAFRLFFGTNGRNGVITEVTLKAKPKPAQDETVALRFADEASAFSFLNAVKQDLKSSLLKVRPIHVEFYGKAYLEQLQQLKPVDAGEPKSFTINLISPEGERKQSLEQDTVLFVFQEDTDKRAFLEYVEKRNGCSLTDQMDADALWEERFYPMKLRKKGDLLTAEIILPLQNVASYLREVTAFANRLGVTLLPVAYVLNSEEALVLPQFLTDSRRLRQYYRHFTLAPILVRRAVKRFGGRPYGFGIWLSGFAKRALGKQAVNELKRAKARFDPHHILNPGKIYEIRSRLGNLFGNLLLHEKTIDLLDLMVSVQSRLRPSAGKASSATKLDPYNREKGDALHRCIKCSACMICPLAQIWERSGDPKLMKDAIHITPRFKMEYMQRHIHEGQRLSQEDVDRFVLCFRCGVAERETVCPISDMLLDVDESDSPCQKTLPTYDDFEARLRREGYDVDGAIARYMDILKTHPGVASAMKDVLGNYRIPKTGDLTVLQPKTDFAVYKVEVDQDRCINCGKCGDEHTTSQRGFWDPRRPRNMVSLDDLLKEQKGKIPNAWFSDVGGPIPAKLKDQGEANGEYVHYPVLSGMDHGHQHCNGCMYCVIECPVDAIRVNINEYYVGLAGEDFTREDIRRINEESRSGGVPTSGTGSTGLFGGKGFDRYMFDFSVIVRPTRDGIREAIDVGVNLGRRPLFHLFENTTSAIPRVKTHFQSIDLPIPILLELPDVAGREHTRDLLDIFVTCAAKQDTLVILSLFQFIENFQRIARLTGNIALRVIPEEVATLKAWVERGDLDGRVLQALTELPLVEVARDLTGALANGAFRPEDELRDLFSRRLLTSNLVLCPQGVDPESVAEHVEELAQSGAQIIHLKSQYNTANGYYESADILPACYERLLAKSLHTQVSLISNGVKSPADLGISMMLGASATVIDRVALAALNHEFCALEKKGEPLPAIDVDTGVQRLENLLNSWKKQIREVLGAFGIRDIRRTVGESGRLIDLRDREKKMQAIVGDTKLAEESSKVNLERIAGDGELAREASWKYSDLGELLRSVTPPNANLLGSRGESLESMLIARGDRRWNSDLLKATWMMASGDIPSYKVPQTGMDNGGGSFDVMRFASVTYQGRKQSLEQAVETIDRGVRAGDQALIKELDQISISSGVTNVHRRVESPPIVNNFPIDAADMSLGSVGWKLTLARYLAGAVLKRFTGTGEGGFPLEKYERLQRFFPQLSPDELRWLAKKIENWVATQTATGYFGVNEDTIRRSRKLVLKFAQGAKPGLGGHILGAKVTTQVEDLRGVIAGISVFSPFPFHDVYSIEDVTKMLEWLRTINPDAIITVKISTPVDVYHVALGLVTGGADEIQIDATAGGTGAAPDIARNRIAMPLEYGLSDVHKFLVEQGERNKVTLVASGGIRSAYDMAKAIILGADKVVIGTQEIVAQQCNRCGNCEAPGGCQKGITTTVEQLEEQKEILLNAQWLINTQVSVVQHLIQMMHVWGVKDIRELRGRTELISDWGWTEAQRPKTPEKSQPLPARKQSKIPAEGWDSSREERKELDACGVVSFACTKPVPVESIQTACQRMHNRGNGRGGGILGLGGMFSKAVKDHYALQIIALGPGKDRPRTVSEIVKKHLANFDIFDRAGQQIVADKLDAENLEHFRNPRRQFLGGDISFEQAALKADPGDMFRFFVRANKRRLVEFAKSILERCRVSEEERHVLNNGNPTEFLQQMNIAGKWIEYYVKYYELLTDTYLHSVDPDSEFWLQPRYENLWRDLEDEFIYRQAVAINEEYYIGPQNEDKNPQAFVASMMKDGGIWKLVGFAEQSADYWLVGDAQYVSPDELAELINEEVRREFPAAKFQLPVSEFQTAVSEYRATGQVQSQSQSIEGSTWRVGDRQLEIEIRPNDERQISVIVPESGNRSVVVFKYGGHIWIGHQRFPTVFSPYSGGSHPFYGRVHEALIHNGDFANYVAMVRFWDQFGGAPQFRTDTEMAAKAYSILKQMGYPQSHIFEAIAPTTGIDMQRLREINPGLATDFETIQKTQIAGSPDGPWFFIIGDQDPVSRDLKIVGLTDTSVLRPSVFAWQHSSNDKWASIGLVGSEEQACRSVLDALYQQGVLATREPDKVKIIRGGSVEQEQAGEVRGGGAIVYNLKLEARDQYRLQISDKFGNSLEPELGQHCDLHAELSSDSEEVKALGVKLFDASGLLRFDKSEPLYRLVADGLKDWEFNTFRWLVETLGHSAKTEERLTLVIETLTCIKDRIQSIDVGSGANAKKRASLIQILTDELEAIFDQIPLIQDGSPGRNYFRVNLSNLSKIFPCSDQKKTLVFDASGFDPEGHHSLARATMQAYSSGWRKFILYKTTGQRYLGVGFGPRSHEMEMHIYGSPGQDIGNSMMGGTIHVHADAQNDMTKILHSGTVVVHGLAGNTGLYGAKGGEVFVRDSVGTRWVINSVSSPAGPGLKVVILGSAMEYLAESLMGGMVLMLGLEWDRSGVLQRKYLPFAGNSILAGASAGKVVIYDPDDRIEKQQYDGAVDMGFLSRDWVAVYRNLQNLVMQSFPAAEWRQYVASWKAISTMTLQSDDWLASEKQEALELLARLFTGLIESKGDYKKLSADSELLKEIIEQLFTGKEWRTLVRQLGQIVGSGTWVDGFDLLERLMDWREVTELLVKTDEFFGLGLRSENGLLYLPIDGGETQIRREDFKVLRPLRAGETLGVPETELEVVGEEDQAALVQ